MCSYFNLIYINKRTLLSRLVFSMDSRKKMLATAARVTGHNIILINKLPIKNTKKKIKRNLWVKKWISRQEKGLDSFSILRN